MNGIPGEHFQSIQTAHANLLAQYGRVLGVVKGNLGTASLRRLLVEDHVRTRAAQLAGIYAIYEAGSGGEQNAWFKSQREMLETLSENLYSFGPALSSVRKRFWALLIGILTYALFTLVGEGDRVQLGDYAVEVIFAVLSSPWMALLAFYMLVIVFYPLIGILLSTYWKRRLFADKPEEYQPLPGWGLSAPVGNVYLYEDQLFNALGCLKVREFPLDTLLDSGVFLGLVGSGLYLIVYYGWVVYGLQPPWYIYLIGGLLLAVLAAWLFLKISSGFTRPR